MKKVFLGLFMAMATMLSISASAQIVTTRATMIQSFDDVRSFEYSTTYNIVEIKYKDNGYGQIALNPLTHFNAIVAAVGGTTGATKFTQVSGTYTYVRLGAAREIYCYSGITKIIWDANSVDNFSDNCALFNKAKANSINAMNY